MRVAANGQLNVKNDDSKDKAQESNKLSSHDEWLADCIDPTRLATARDYTGVSGARAKEVGLNPSPLSKLDLDMVNELLGKLHHVTDPGEQVQVSTWVKQYLTGDPRHDAVIHWPLPFMDLHTHVNGVLTTEAFLNNVKASIRGVECPFWEDFSKRYAKFLDSLNSPIKGREFEYGFNDHYRAHAACGMPNLSASSDANFEALGKALELVGPGKEHSCSISYAHAYDLRGMVRDAVEAVTPDKGVWLTRRSLEDVAESLRKQRVGSVDMQVSMTFLERPDAMQLLECCNARGIHVNYLPYELSVKRLHRGELSEEDEKRLRANFEKPICSGIDYCGAEFPFTKEGMKVFKRTLFIMREVANQTQRVLIMRPHVGEGFRADHARASPKEVGRNNIEMILRAIEEFNSEHGKDPLVEIRFGHATHSTADQDARMHQLGIVVEGNPLSNETTGVATRDEHGILNWVTYAVQHLFGTDGAGVMGGGMQQVEELEEAVLWAFRNGYASKETVLGSSDDNRGRLAFSDLVKQRADEIFYARQKRNRQGLQSLSEEPSADDQAQAEREIWNIFSMERVKGLAELRRLDIGWKMRKTGEIPSTAARKNQLFAAIMAATRGDFLPMNQFLKCVYFFRGRMPYLPKPTGMPFAFSPQISLTRKGTLPSLIALAANQEVKSKKVQETKKSSPLTSLEKKEDPVIQELRGAVIAACEKASYLDAPTIEELRGQIDDAAVSVEEAFACATSQLSRVFETQLGKRIEVGTGRRAAVEGWTLVLDESRNIVGLQLMANTNEKGELSHYSHLGAGAAQMKLGDNLVSYFTRMQPDLLAQRGGAGGLMSGPTGKPIVFAGPVDLNADDKRMGLFAAFVTQTTEASVGGKFVREGQEHRVLVRNEKGQIESVVQQRQMPKKWTTITLEEMTAYLESKIKADQVVGHTSDLIYLMKQIKALQKTGKPISIDALARRLQQGALVADDKRDTSQPSRPLDRISATGQRLLSDYFSKIASIFAEVLMPLSEKGKANFKVVRDFIEKGGGDFKGLGKTLEKRLGGLSINIGDSPFVTVQFRNEKPIRVPMGRTIMSLAPKGYEDKAWHLESLTPDSTGHGLLLRYWDANMMAA